uniref:Uncharacterized protein n=1 Tax=Arundo donax TaxID=35708 RepID=A0A0A9DVF0_ARUDO
MNIDPTLTEFLLYPRFFSAGCGSS